MEDILHDLKHIAQAQRALAKALDDLYEHIYAATIPNDNNKIIGFKDLDINKEEL